MAHTVAINLALGSSQTGLALEALIVDLTGAPVGSAVTTGFTEIGVGNYLHSLSVPDGQRGGVIYRLSSDHTTVKAFVALNPEEVENADTKTSTREAGATLGTDVQAALTAQGYTTARAGKLDNLDVAVGSRAPNGTVGITVTSPVASNGDIWITIGDDYGPVPAFQQRITHTFHAGSEPDYTGGSAVYAAPGLAASPFAATLVTVGPAVDQTFALDLSHATTSGLLPGDYPFALEATTATGQRTTPRKGVIHVRPATP